MPERLMWTALPDGVAGEAADQRLRLSVLVSPRLTTAGGADAVLGDFADLRHWASTVAGITFAVEFDGQSVAANLRPRNQVEPGLWDALFTDDTLVRSHAFDDYSGHRLISYPVRPLRDAVRQLYGSVAVDWGFDLPPLGGEGGGLGPSLHQGGWVPGTSGPASEALTAFQRFHDRTRTFPPLPPFGAEDAGPPVFDFHQGVACLGDYPLLLRRLGLVIDLEVPAAGIPTAATPRLLRVRPGWTPGDPASPRPDVCPATRSIWDGNSFAAAAAGPDLHNGVLALTDTRFCLVDSDVDGGAHKIVNLGLNLLAVQARKAVDAPRAAALPTLRSAGLSLVRDGRAPALHDQLSRAGAQNAVLDGASPDDAVFNAEQLVRGYLVDVWDSATRTWHTLCGRVGRYRFERTGAERVFEDEGFVQLSAAEASAGPQPPSEPELYLHESLLRWGGWSLVAPRPGLAIPADGDPAAPMERPDNAAATSLQLQVGFTPAAASLPRLRFGVAYRLRLRVADLAGNSVRLRDAGDASALPAVAPGHVYRRYEPVPSPAVVLRHPLTRASAPGESVDRVVIRSANTDGGGDAAPTADIEDRHVAPPRTTPALAELHGAFDDASGRLKGDAATYRMIAERDAARLDQEAEVPVAPGDRLVLPYLPDVLARGAALRDLPGVAEGTVGRLDDDGRLVYQPAQVLPRLARSGTGRRPGSVTQIDFGPAETWPALEPFRVLLREGTQPPTWDPQHRVLTVALAKGEVAEVALSCYLSPADLDLFAVWDWMRREIDAQTATTTHPALLESLAERVLALTQRTLEGGHWALTPARTLVLVHAVQQPLGRPVIDGLTATRGFGATGAHLLGGIRVHLPSTGRIDLLGRWDEVSPPAPGPATPAPAGAGAGQRWAAEGPVAELRLHGKIVEKEPIPFADRTVAHFDPGSSTILMSDRGAPWHEFGDTRHRVVRYRAAATSRFSEYFLRESEQTLRGTAATVLDPGGISPRSETVRSSDGATTFARAESGTGDYEMDYGSGTIARVAGGAIPDGSNIRVEFLPPVTRDSDEVTVHVPSSARPAAPRVLYVVPAFEWRRQTGTNLLASHRRGHWLRVYLEGPWFSSGEGEQLAVVVGGGQGELARYVTQIGLDPLRSGGGLPSGGFPHGTEDSGPVPPGPFASGVGLTLEELSPTIANRVRVYAHDVAFDDERGLWYCDIKLGPNLSGDRAFEPFVRLALARYQRHSVLEFDPATPDRLRDVKLSRVVLADFAQLPADRSVLVTYDPHRPARLRVVVSGDGYAQTFQTPGPSQIVLSVQQRQPGLVGDLAWTSADGVTVVPDEPAQTPPSAVLWRGEVVLPDHLSLSELRVVVEECDTLLADDPDQPRRLLFADTVELGGFGLTPPGTDRAATRIDIAPRLEIHGTTPF